MPHFKPQTLNDWMQVAANAVIALSAAFAAYQYYQTRADARVDRTLQIVQRFEAADYAPTRNAITEIAAKSRDALQAAFADHHLAGLSSSERRDLRTRLVLSVIYGNRNDPPGALIEVVGFFGTLQSCIEQRVCDAETAHAFFGTYADSFWRDFHEVADYERAHSRATFAAGLERFVGWGKSQR